MSTCGTCGSQTPNIHVNDYGLTFVFEAKEYPADFDPCSQSLCDLDPLDISGFTALAVKFRKPDGTVTTVTDPAVTLTTDGTDGKFQYIAAAGLFDQAGRWTRQGVVTTATFQHSGPQVCFSVDANIE